MHFNLREVAKETPTESLQAHFSEFVTLKPKKYESVNFGYIRQAMETCQDTEATYPELNL